jgi:hypothetical protein
VARALVATATRTRGPPHGPRDGRVGPTPPGTGAAPRAAGPRRRATPRPLLSARESASPLGAPPLQNFPSALRRHPLAESVRLGAPATIRLKGPLHDVLLVRAMRTARPSYRRVNDAVKREARLRRAWRGCRSREARAMVGRPVPGRSAARGRGARRDRHGPHRYTECAKRRQPCSRSYPPPWISVCVTRSRRKVPHAR